MKPVPERFEIEVLLAESEWVGGLAFSLMGNSHEAEDLAQEVWLAALRRPPGKRDSARPWIATVARNAARMLRRSDGTRRDREAAVARVSAEKAGAPAEELASRLESQELVLGLVRELPDELSDVVLLSFFEGLSSEEIARLRGLKSGTVRWRKKRALEQLRERLDTHHDGDRSAWLSALAPLAGSFSRRVAEATSAGGALTSTLSPWIRMAFTWKSASILTALILTALALSSGDGEGLSSAPDESAASGDAIVAVAAKSDALRELPAAVDVEPESRVVVAPQQPSGATVSARLETRVRLRVVDANGSVVVGAVVSAMPSAEPGSALGADLAELSTDALALLQASLVSTTDGMGEAKWTTDFLREPEVIDFDVVGPGFGKGRMSAVIEPGADVDLGELVLSSGGSVRGEVRMSGGEQPGRRIIELGPAELPKSAAGLARLRGFGPDGADRTSTCTKAGEFEFKGVPPGEYRAFISTMGSETSGWSEPFVVVAGERLEGVVILLESVVAERFEVLVLDQQGEPLVTADVKLQLGESIYSSRVDGDGLWSPRAGIDSFVGGRLVVSENSLRYRRVTLDPIQRQAGRVVVRMQSAATVERNLTVVDAAGVAVENVRVSVIASGGRRDLQKFASASPLRLPAAIEGDFELRVAAAGYRSLVLEGLSADGLGDPWVVTLEALPGIRGRVLAGGEPVERAKVYLSWKAAPGKALAKGNLVTQLVGSFSKVQTDADGVFLVHSDEDGELALTVTARGYAPAVIELPGYRASSGVDGIVIELDRGGEVRGVVRDHRGIVVPRASVVLNHPLLGLLQKTARRDGSFHFKRVPAGDWYLRVVEDLGPGTMTFSVSLPEGWSYPANCHVVAGEELVHDLALSDRESTRILGHLTATGVAVGSLALEISDDATNMFSGDPFADSFDFATTLDADGAFDVALPEGQAYDVAVSSPELGASLRRAVGADELPLTLETEFGFAQLEIQVPSWLERGAGSDWIAVDWSADGWRYFERLTADPSGQVAALIVPAGTLTLEWRPAAGAGLRKRTIELESGEERVVVLE